MSYTVRYFLENDRQMHYLELPVRSTAAEEWAQALEAVEKKLNEEGKTLEALASITIRGGI